MQNRTFEPEAMPVEPPDPIPLTQTTSPNPVQRQLVATNPARSILSCTRQWGQSPVTATKAVHRQILSTGCLVAILRNGLQAANLEESPTGNLQPGRLILQEGELRATGHIRKVISLVWLPVVWVLAVGFGLLRLQDYSTTPAIGARPPQKWPESSALVRRSDRLTVVMFAHPQCPCTRASLGELAIAATQAAGLIDIRVVFLQAPAFELESDLWRSARDIPNTQIHADRDGAEIRKFGVNASGHTLAYDAEGNLVFSGGVVSARGHAGANRGREAVVQLARTGRSNVATTPVLGCALQNRESLASTN